jgi:hypothetical protein
MALDRFVTKRHLFIAILLPYLVLLMPMKLLALDRSDEVSIYQSYELQQLQKLTPSLEELSSLILRNSSYENTIGAQADFDRAVTMADFQSTIKDYHSHINALIANHTGLSELEEEALVTYLGMYFDFVLQWIKSETKVGQQPTLENLGDYSLILPSKVAVSFTEILSQEKRWEQLVFTNHGLGVRIGVAPEFFLSQKFEAKTLLLSRHQSPESMFNLWKELAAHKLYYHVQSIQTLATLNKPDIAVPPLHEETYQNTQTKSAEQLYRNSLFQFILDPETSQKMGLTSDKTMLLDVLEMPQEEIASMLDKVFSLESVDATPEEIAEFVSTTQNDLAIREELFRLYLGNWPVNLLVLSQHELSLQLKEILLKTEQDVRKLWVETLRAIAGEKITELMAQMIDDYSNKQYSKNELFISNSLNLGMLTEIFSQQWQENSLSQRDVFLNQIAVKVTEMMKIQKMIDNNSPDPDLIVQMPIIDQSVSSELSSLQLGSQLQALRQLVFASPDFSFKEAHDVFHQVLKSSLAQYRHTLETIYSDRTEATTPKYRQDHFPHLDRLKHLQARYQKEITPDEIISDTSLNEENQVGLEPNPNILIENMKKAGEKASLKQKKKDIRDLVALGDLYGFFETNFGKNSEDDVPSPVTMSQWQVSKKAKLRYLKAMQRINSTPFLETKLEGHKFYNPKIMWQELGRIQAADPDNQTSMESLVDTGLAMNLRTMIETVQTLDSVINPKDVALLLQHSDVLQDLILDFPYLNIGIEDLLTEINDPYLAEKLFESLMNRYVMPGMGAIIVVGLTSFFARKVGWLSLSSKASELLFMAHPAIQFFNLTALPLIGVHIANDTYKLFGPGQTKDQWDLAQNVYHSSYNGEHAVLDSEGKDSVEGVFVTQSISYAIARSIDVFFVGFIAYQMFPSVKNAVRPLVTSFVKLRWRQLDKDLNTLGIDAKNLDFLKEEGVKAAANSKIRDILDSTRDTNSNVLRLTKGKSTELGTLDQIKNQTKFSSGHYRKLRVKDVERAQMRVLQKIADTKREWASLAGKYRKDFERLGLHDPLIWYIDTMQVGVRLPTGVFEEGFRRMTHGLAAGDIRYQMAVHSYQRLRMLLESRLALSGISSGRDAALREAWYGQFMIPSRSEKVVNGWHEFTPEAASSPKLFPRIEPKLLEQRP